MSGIKICHISDLHCNKSSKWKNNFKNLRRAITKELPDIIFISGDCVDNPSDENFSDLANEIKSLIEELKKKAHEPYILTVPGNHDYYKYGLKLARFRQTTTDLFQKYSSKLISCVDCRCDKIEDVAERIYERFSVAVFPFDSNEIEENTVLNFAQGRISDPEGKYNYYKNIYTKVGSNDEFENSLKIALLHHHPLPLPTSRKEEKLEGFLVLKNSYEFLEHSLENDIDLILHGHKHSSGVAEYKAYNKGSKSMLIVSCASSTHDRESQREMKILNFSDNKTLELSIYRASDNAPSFARNEMPVELISYSSVRKAKSAVQWLQASPIATIVRKTKIISIQKDGNAAVRIDYNGIAWRKGITYDDMRIKETLRADIGRISSLSSMVCEEGEVVDEKQSMWESSSNVDTRHIREPDKPHFIPFEAKPFKLLNNKAEAKSTVRYILVNGYTLTKYDHNEAHRIRCDFIEETCSIQADYPTEVLELVVKFPKDPSFFPDENHVYLVATEKPTEQQELALSILKGDLRRDEQECSFLRAKHAVRYRRDAQEVVVVIRHPQPDLLYTLRWALPEDKRLATLNREDTEIAERLRTTFLNREASSLEGFFKGMADNITALTDRGDLDIFLLGHDNENKYLKIVLGAEKFPDVKPTYVGRGVVGKAFRARQTFYWRKRGTNDELGPSYAEPEPLIPNYRPVEVLALPLTYPRISPSRWDELSRSGKEGRCPVFGVLSIVSTGGKPVFDVLDENSGDEAMKTTLLEAFYGVIWTELSKNFNYLQ